MRQLQSNEINNISGGAFPFDTAATPVAIATLITIGEYTSSAAIASAEAIAATNPLFVGAAAVGLATVGAIYWTLS